MLKLYGVVQFLPGDVLSSHILHCFGRKESDFYEA